MTLPHIIGLSGVARAGKDTVAKVLHDLYGYQPVSFSDMLNQALLALDPWVRTGYEDWSRYSVVIERNGYEDAKDRFEEVRRLLQAMGTEVGRNLLGENIWVDALFNNLPSGLVAITNVRFPNEFSAVLDRDGVNWRINRPGFTPSNNHISDTALDGYIFDQHIENDGTVRDLAQKVIEAVSWHQGLDVNGAHNEGSRAGS